MRLMLARMLLEAPSLLLLDEPTNHLDLDSKDVLLDALMDYGGTLIVVSHDRYFIDKLATKVIEIGNGRALLYPGTYEEFHWSKTHAGQAPALPDGLGRASRAPSAPKPAPKPAPRPAPAAKPARAAAPGAGAATPPAAAPKADRVAGYDAKKRADADARKRDRERKDLQARITDLEGRITEREQEIARLEAAMAVPGFYEDREQSKAVVGRHQTLMWEVGDLMGQWEALQAHAAERA